MPLIVLAILAHRVGENWVSLKEVLIDSILTLKGALISMALLFLMVINFGSEALKFKLVLSNAELTLSRITKSVFKGKSYGVLLPTVVGDMLARSIDIKEKSKLKVASVLFLCGVSQLFVTLLFGISASMFYMYEDVVKNQYVWFFSLGGLFLCVVVLLVWVWLPTVLSGFKKKYSQLKEHVQSVGFEVLSKLISVSFMRYAVIALQYVLVLLILQHSLTFHFVGAVAVFLLIKTVIPTANLLFDLGVRNMSAVTVFGSIAGLTVVEALVLSNFIWLINGLAPALVGTVIALFDKTE